MLLANQPQQPAQGFQQMGESAHFGRGFGGTGFYRGCRGFSA